MPTTKKLIAFANARGVAIDETQALFYLTRANDYLSTLCWIGTAPDTNGMGEAWPRVLVEGEAAVTPNAILEAQLRLAIEAAQGVDLLPTVSGPQVVQETVGPITTKYSEPTLGAGPTFPWLDNLIAPYLLCEQSGDYGNFDVWAG